MRKRIEKPFDDKAETERGNSTENVKVVSFYGII